MKAGPTVAQLCYCFVSLHPPKYARARAIYGRYRTVKQHGRRGNIRKDVESSRSQSHYRSTNSVHRKYTNYGNFEARWTPWLCPRLFPPNFWWAFVPIDPMNVHTKFEVRSLTCFWDNRGYPKMWAVLGNVHAPFPPKFLMGLFAWNLWMYRPNLVRSSTSSWDNRDFSFGCELIANLQSRETWRRGTGMVPLETFPLSLRVSEILPHLCSSTPLFPTPSLVSSKFPHVPLGIGGWPLGYEEGMCWANCTCN